MTGQTDQQLKAAETPQDKTKALAAAIAYRESQVHADNTADIKKRFEILDAESERIMPVNVFVVNFLPIFNGTVEMSPEMLALWYQISGGPFGEVVIKDMDGNTLSVIPPLFDRDLLEISKVKANVPYMFKQFENMLNISPSLAKSELSLRLMDTFGIKQDHADRLIESRKKWEEALAVFAFANGESPKAKQLSNVDDDVDYT